MSQPEFPTVVDDNPELQPASPKQASLAVVPSPPSMAVGPIGVNIEALMQKAVDAKSAVEVLERLMVMRREIQSEAAKAAFDKAMAAFQAECPVIVKSEAVHNKGGNSVRYRYAPLDVIVSQVKGLLEKHGLSHSETAQVEKDWVTAVCTVKHCQGHSEKSEFKVPIDPEAFMNAAQKFASALTFAKRYAFCNAFGILTGDADDDARSSHAEPPQTGPGRVESPPGVSTHPPQAQTQPQQAAGKPKETTIPHATAETRQKLVERLMALQNVGEEQILEYFRKLDNPTVLLPTEGLLDLPLEFVPVTQKQFEALKVAIVAFTEGAPAKHAFPPNPVASPAPAAKPVEVPRDKDTATPEQTGAWNDEPWYSVIVPVPRKGMKRQEYLQNPDTIGSLFLMRHEQTEEGADARRRLWGFVTNYEPKGWTKTNGQQMPPSKSDIDFRKALDQFAAWFEKNHPGEKL